VGRDGPPASAGGCPRGPRAPQQAARARLEAADGAAVRARRDPAGPPASRRTGAEDEHGGCQLGDGEVDVAFVLPSYRAGEAVRSVDLFPLPVYVYVSIESPLAGLEAVRFEDVADEVFPRQAPGVAHKFADLFYLTALRGHRPAVSAHAPLTPDETWALVASGGSITTAPGSFPTLAADAIRRIPTIDIPPFTMRLMWGADASPAALVFVEFVRATFGAAQLRAA
jgi:hypothetical protein